MEARTGRPVASWLFAHVWLDTSRSTVRAQGRSTVSEQRSCGRRTDQAADATQRPDDNETTMATRPTRLLISAVLLLMLAACGSNTDPAVEPAAAADGNTAADAEVDAAAEPDATDAACTTSLQVTTSDGETTTLTSANIQTIYGGDTVTVFAADFPIEDHDVPGRPPNFPTDEGQMVWLDLGAPGIDSDAPQLGTGDTATLPGSERTAFAASLISADRIDPLFGDDLAGTIELLQLEDDGACIDIDVTIAGVEFRGTAAAESVLRGE